MKMDNHKITLTQSVMARRNMAIEVAVAEEAEEGAARDKLPTDKEEARAEGLASST